MVQRYTEIPATQKICESLTPLLDNDKTGISCNAGTTFPTVNLQEGMLCYRTDEKKLYELTNVNDPSNSWRMVADCTADFRHIEGGQGNAINYDYKDLNNWMKMPTGFYEGVSMLNAPPTDDEEEVSRWRVLQFRHGNSDGWATQLAFSFNKDLIMTRTQKGGDWTEWAKVVIAKNDGSMVEGLNAEKVAGYTAGNEADKLAINNGKVNENLNADMVDGYHAGNGQNEVPISNFNLNLNLNSDMLDGYHAGNKKGQIPVSNGQVCQGLNAETVGGYGIKQLVTKSSDGRVEAQTFQSATAGTFSVQAADGLDATFNVNPGETTRVDHALLGVSDVNSKFDFVLDQVQGSGDYQGKRTILSVNTIPGFFGGGNYSLVNIIKNLAKTAHYHYVYQEPYRYNCKCDCRCDCDCGDDNSSW